MNPVPTYSPTPCKRLRLTTVRGIRRELGAVYIEMRRGQMEPALGTKLAFVLGTLARMLETQELERRIEALERPTNGE